MTVNELKNNISRGKLENIYLFSGPEIGEKNEVLEMLEKRIFKNEKPMVYKFYCANDFDPVEFSDTMNSNLLFSEKKIIILKNIELANKNMVEIIENLLIPGRIIKDSFESGILGKAVAAKKEKDLSAYYHEDNGYYILNESIKESEHKKIVVLFNSIGYSHIDDNTCLVMVNESGDKIPAGITNLLSQNQHIIFWEMFESQKTGWVRAEFKKYNLFIDDTAVEFILDMVENNKFFLENEIRNIAVSYDGLKKDDKKVITRELIEEYLYHSKEETSFTLFSSLIEKNASKALEILDKIFYSEDDSLINGLLWSLRRFLRALDLYENQNMSIEEIYSTLQITAKKGKDELNSGLKNYDYSHISVMFYYLSELDYFVKILPDELKIIKLQEFILNFIMGDMKNSFLTGELIHFQIGNKYGTS
jgi:DNA polymerase III subunit delta